MQSQVILFFFVRVSAVLKVGFSISSPARNSRIQHLVADLISLLVS